MDRLERNKKHPMEGDSDWAVIDLFRFTPADSPTPTRTSAMRRQR
jgi:hypothetical protein